MGEAEIPYRQIQAAEQSLRISFPLEGRSTLIWHLIDGGLAAEALLHARLPELSGAAHQEAELWADRLRHGEDFLVVLEHWQAQRSEPPVLFHLQKPGPFFVGASVSARIAAMEEGDWAGPLRTEVGWEIIRLVVRDDAPRALAQVQIERLVFPVGSEAERLRAKEDGAKLPFSGHPDLLDALPLEVRRARTAPPEAGTP